MFASRMGAATVEIPASHVAMVSRPSDVAQLVETAAHRSRALATAGSTGQARSTGQ